MTTKNAYYSVDLVRKLAGMKNDECLPLIKIKNTFY